MKAKIILVISWVIASPLVFLGLLVSYHLYTSRLRLIPLQLPLLTSADQPVQAADAVFPQVQGINSDVEVADARPVIIAEFLEKHDSPLQPYDYWGQFLTTLADKYEMDFRLLPSIAMQESNLCKKIPENTYNCLGLGIHARGTWSFKRYEDNFEAAAKILREKYIDKGYVTVDEIQDKYNPGSNGSWEFAVNHFMDVLEYADF